MRILIGTPHATTTSAKARFVDCLIDLITHTRQEGHTVDRMSTYRDNIVFARNKIATKAIREGYDYLFFLDDDMTFEKELLINLLKKDKLVVAGLAFMRREPHEPSMFTLANDKETFNPIVSWKAGETLKVDAVGMACTLIAFGTLTKVAYSSNTHKGIITLFDNVNSMGEDLSFCLKLNNDNIYCDTSQLVGHIVEKEILFGDFASMAQGSMISMNSKIQGHNYEKQLKK